jgi:hypothetical protein
MPTIVGIFNFFSTFFAIQKKGSTFAQFFSFKHVMMQKLG